MGAGPRPEGISWLGTINTSLSKVMLSLGGGGEFLSSREVQVKIEGDLQGRKWCVYVGVDRREWALSLVEEGTHLFCIW